MWDFFYNFANQSLAWDLYTRDAEDGTPSPPQSVVMITEDELNMITEDGQYMITEG